MRPELTLAITAAREAGIGIMSLYKSTKFDTKSDGSPVTEADLLANEIIHTHLLPTHIQILSEEVERAPLSFTAPVWVIDPIDGTIGFVKKTGDFAVMIALVENGRPVLGVVYAPADDSLYYAEKGNGAFLEKNGVTTKLSVSTRTTESLRILRSVNHFTPLMQSVAGKLNAVQIPQGSVGLKAGKLAENEGDFFFSEGALGEWDVCAPEIIALEAGGMVTDFDGKPIFYGTTDHRIANGMIFSNGACHELVRERIIEKTL